MFQHTAARRRLHGICVKMREFSLVSTHSRPKAAAIFGIVTYKGELCFNTQPPEGGCEPNGLPLNFDVVSTHSRPKAAAFWLFFVLYQ